MTSVELQNVCVQFVVFSGVGRSLKQQVIQTMTGGRLSSNNTDRVVVRALENVSMSLRSGDRLALLGHNGAGKSTLLRLLAGVYEPVAGTVKIEGRIAPMFDISLGMDPESTGYENIFLRALYLGIKAKDIKERVEEIAEFAELGDFLYLPVRTYSTGMAIRLAFAISTTIDPEIILLDEWLGAGDASFIKKAEARMHELVARAGIVVLASHNTEIVRKVCNKAMLFEHGQVIAAGDVEEVLNIYDGGGKAGPAAQPEQEGAVLQVASNAPQ